MKENKNKSNDEMNKDSDYRKRRGNPHGNAPGKKGGKGDDNLREGVSEAPRSKQ